MKTSETEPGRDQVLLVLALSTAFGTYLRMKGVEAGKHLWNDSVVSIVVVDRLGPAEILAVLPTYDPHPPLYYLLLDAWTTVFGSSVLAGRSMSVVLGVASIPLVYLVAADLSNRYVGIASAALLTASPYHVRVSQTLRMYALLLAVSLVSYLVFLRLLERWGRRRGLVYACATFVAGGVHAFGALVVVSQSVMVIWLDRRHGGVPRKRQVLGLQSAVALALTPWYATLLSTSVSGRGYSLDWLASPGYGDVFESLSLYLRPELTEVGFLWIAALLPATTLLIVGLYGWGLNGVEREHLERTNVVITTWLVLPVLVAFVASYVLSPVLHPRYFASTSIAALIAVSRGLLTVESRDLRLVLLVVVLLPSAVGLSVYYDGTTALRQEGAAWEPAASYVDGNAAPDDVVLVDHGDAPSKLKEIQIAPNASIRSSDFFDVHLRRDDVELVGMDSVDPVDIQEDVGCHRGIWVVFHGRISSRDRIDRVLSQMDETYEAVDTRMFNQRMLVARYRQSPGEIRNCS